MNLFVAAHCSKVRNDTGSWRRRVSKTRYTKLARILRKMVRPNRTSFDTSLTKEFCS